MSGSVAVTPKSSARSSLVNGNAIADADDQPEPRQLQTFADHQPDDVAAFRAERHAHAELRVRWLVEKLITP